MPAGVLVGVGDWFVPVEEAWADVAPGEVAGAVCEGPPARPPPVLRPTANVTTPAASSTAVAAASSGAPHDQRERWFARASTRPSEPSVGEIEAAACESTSRSLS